MKKVHLTLQGVSAALFASSKKKYAQIHKVPIEDVKNADVEKSILEYYTANKGSRLN